MFSPVDIEGWWHLVGDDVLRAKIAPRAAQSISVKTGISIRDQFRKSKIRNLGLQGGMHIVSD